MGSKRRGSGLPEVKRRKRVGFTEFELLLQKEVSSNRFWSLSSPGLKTCKGCSNRSLNHEQELAICSKFWKSSKALVLARFLPPQGSLKMNFDGSSFGNMGPANIVGIIRDYDDIGVEANDCVKIFLVSKPEEVDCAESFCISPVDLNQFFGEDGKIYGYKDLKINIWLSSRSFHAYPDISFQKSFKGAMGITDLNPVFQIMFGESLVVKKDEFLDTFSTEHNYIRDIVSNGTVIHSKVLEQHDDSSNYLSEAVSSTTEHQVIRMDPSSGPVGQLYSRLVPLVLLLVEGGRAIDISDPRWDIYFAVEKASNQLGAISIKLLGFATMYRFYHHPDSTRFRISQLLVLPPYQGHGHGRLLLETINSIAIAEDVYDVTAEEPSDYLQQIRVCIDTLRLLTFEPVQPSVTTIASQLKESNLSKKAGKFCSDPPADIIEEARKQLKINKKQFLRCWEVLIYLYLHPDDQKSIENFKTCIADRLKADILEKNAETNGKSLIDVPSDYNPQMTFVVFQAASEVKVNGGVNGNENNDQDDQLNQVVDKHVEGIVEIAKKVATHAAKS